MYRRLLAWSHYVFQCVVDDDDDIGDGACHLGLHKKNNHIENQCSQELRHVMVHLSNQNLIVWCMLQHTYSISKWKKPPDFFHPAIFRSGQKRSGLSSDWFSDVLSLVHYTHAYAWQEQTINTKQQQQNQTSPIGHINLYTCINQYSLMQDVHFLFCFNSICMHMHMFWDCWNLRFSRLTPAEISKKK